MLSLTMGTNAPIDEERFDLVVQWPGHAGVLDCSAFLLGAAGKVRGDDDFIFYNQPEANDGSVRIAGSGSDQTRFAFDLGRVSPDVERTMVCAVVEGHGAGMGDFAGLHATLVAGAPRLRFEPEVAREAALRLIELYRRAGRWKIRAVGQGFGKGLGPLARSFGVDVADDEDEVADVAAAPVGATIPLPTAPPPPPPPPAGPPSVPPEPAPTSSRVTLVATPPPPRPRGFDAPPTGRPPARKRQPGRAAAPDDALRLDTVGARHLWGGGSADRDLVARLTWSSRCGGSDGRARALTLWLATFYALADGRRGALQIGDRRGPIGDLPLELGEPTALRGDASQSLTIAGSAWPHLATIVLYAVIEGAPNWRAADIELVLTVVGQPPVAAAFKDGADGDGALAMVQLSSSADGLEVTRLALYGQDQLDLDELLGWNAAWRHLPL